LIINQIIPGIKYKIAKFNIGNHPPKNNTLMKQHIKIIFIFSPKKNWAKVIAEYSTKYPATNSASASGKSKGGLLVSANAEI
jgi:hypothetical protein